MTMETMSNSTVVDDLVFAGQVYLGIAGIAATGVGALAILLVYTASIVPEEVKNEHYRPEQIYVPLIGFFSYIFAPLAYLLGALRSLVGSIYNSVVSNPVLFILGLVSIILSLIWIPFYTELYDVLVGPYTYILVPLYRVVPLWIVTFVRIIVETVVPITNFFSRELPSTFFLGLLFDVTTCTADTFVLFFTSLGKAVQALPIGFVEWINRGLGAFVWRPDFIEFGVGLAQAIRTLELFINCVCGSLGILFEPLGLALTEGTPYALEAGPSAFARFINASLSFPFVVSTDLLRPFVFLIVLLPQNDPSQGVWDAIRPNFDGTYDTLFDVQTNLYGIADDIAGQYYDAFVGSSQVITVSSNSHDDVSSSLLSQSHVRPLFSDPETLQEHCDGIAGPEDCDYSVACNLLSFDDCENFDGCYEDINFNCLTCSACTPPEPILCGQVSPQDCPTISCRRLNIIQCGNSIGCYYEEDQCWPCSVCQPVEIPDPPPEFFRCFAIFQWIGAPETLSIGKGWFSIIPGLPYDTLWRSRAGQKYLLNLLFNMDNVVSSFDGQLLFRYDEPYDLANKVAKCLCDFVNWVARLLTTFADIVAGEQTGQTCPAIDGNSDWENAGICILHIVADFIKWLCCNFLEYVNLFTQIPRFLFYVPIQFCYTLVTRILVDESVACVEPIDPSLGSYCEIPKNPGFIFDVPAFVWGDREPREDSCPPSLCNLPVCESNDDCKSLPYGTAQPFCDSRYNRCVVDNTGCADETPTKAIPCRTFNLEADCVMGSCQSFESDPELASCSALDIAFVFPCDCTCAQNEFRTLGQDVVNLINCTSTFIIDLGGRKAEPYGCFLTELTNIVNEGALVVLDIFVHTDLLFTSPSTVDIDINAFNRAVLQSAQCLQRGTSNLPTNGDNGDNMSTIQLFNQTVECLTRALLLFARGVWEFISIVFAFFVQGTISIDAVEAVVLIQVQGIVELFAAIIQVLGFFLSFLDLTAGNDIFDAGVFLKDIAPTLALILTEVLSVFIECVVGIAIFFLNFFGCLSELTSGQVDGPSCTAFGTSLLPCLESIGELLLQLLSLLFEELVCFLEFARCALGGFGDPLSDNCDYFGLGTCEDVNFVCIIGQFFCWIPGLRDILDLYGCAVCSVNVAPSDAIVCLGTCAVGIEGACIVRVPGFQDICADTIEDQCPGPLDQEALANICADVPVVRQCCFSETGAFIQTRPCGSLKYASAIADLETCTLSFTGGSACYIWIEPFSVCLDGDLMTSFYEQIGILPPTCSASSNCTLPDPDGLPTIPPPTPPPPAKRSLTTNISVTHEDAYQLALSSYVSTVHQLQQPVLLQLLSRNNTNNSVHMLCRRTLLSQFSEDQILPMYDSIAQLQTSSSYKLLLSSCVDYLEYEHNTLNGHAPYPQDYRFGSFFWLAGYMTKFTLGAVGILMKSIDDSPQLHADSPIMSTLHSGAVPFIGENVMSRDPRYCTSSLLTSAIVADWFAPLVGVPAEIGATLVRRLALNIRPSERTISVARSLRQLTNISLTFGRKLAKSNGHVVLAGAISGSARKHLVSAGKLTSSVFSQTHPKFRQALNTFGSPQSKRAAHTRDLVKRTIIDGNKRMTTVYPAIKRRIIDNLIARASSIIQTTRNANSIRAQKRQSIQPHTFDNYTLFPLPILQTDFDTCSITDTPFVCCDDQELCTDCSSIDRIFFATERAFVLIGQYYENDYIDNVVPCTELQTTVTQHGMVIPNSLACPDQVCDLRDCYRDEQCVSSSGTQFAPCDVDLQKCIVRESDCADEEHAGNQCFVFDGDSGVLGTCVFGNCVIDASTAFSGDCQCPDTFLTRNKTVPFILDRLPTVQWPWTWNWSNVILTINPDANLTESGQIPDNHKFSSVIVDKFDCDTSDTNNVFCKILNGLNSLFLNLGTNVAGFVEDTVYLVSQLFSGDIGESAERFFDEYVICDYNASYYCYRQPDSSQYPECCSDTCQDRIQGTSLFDGLIVGSLLVLVVSFTCICFCPLCFAFTSASGLFGSLFFALILSIAYGGTLLCYISGFLLLLLPILTLLTRCIGRCFTLCRLNRITMLCGRLCGLLTIILTAIAIIPGLPVCIGSDFYQLTSELVPPCFPLPVDLVNTTQPGATAACGTFVINPSTQFPSAIDCVTTDAFTQTQFSDGLDPLLYWVDRKNLTRVADLLDTISIGPLSFISQRFPLHTTAAHDADEPLAGACARVTSPGIPSFIAFTLLIIGIAIIALPTILLILGFLLGALLWAMYAIWIALQQIKLMGVYRLGPNGRVPTQQETMYATPKRE